MLTIIGRVASSEPSHQTKQKLSPGHPRGDACAHPALDGATLATSHHKVAGKGSAKRFQEAEPSQQPTESRFECRRPWHPPYGRSVRRRTTLSACARKSRVGHERVGRIAPPTGANRSTHTPPEWRRLDHTRTRDYIPFFSGNPGVIAETIGRKRLLARRLHNPFVTYR